MNDVLTKRLFKDLTRELRVQNELKILELSINSMPDNINEMKKISKRLNCLYNELQVRNRFDNMD